MTTNDELPPNLRRKRLRRGYRRHLVRLLGVTPTATELNEADSKILFARRVRIARDLMDYYDIDRRDKLRWQLLAFRLIDICVPAAKSSTSGRPSSRSRWRFAPRKKPGRPIDVANRDRLRQLLVAVAKLRAKLALSGHGWQRRALRAHIREIARDRGVSVERVTTQEMPRLERDLSKAKQLFPEIAEKLRD